MQDGVGGRVGDRPGQDRGQGRQGPGAVSAAGAGQYPGLQLRLKGGPVDVGVEGGLVAVTDGDQE